MFSTKNTPKDFYVYLYLRNDETPYYVGKGLGARAWADHRVGVPRDLDRIKIIAHRLTENEAFFLEKSLIKQFGRKDLGTGILRNMTEGGEGTAGRVTTEITKSKISDAKSGKPNKGVGWNKGIKYDDELKQRMDLSGLAKGHGWNRGQKLTQEHRDNLKKAWEKRRVAKQINNK